MQATFGIPDTLHRADIKYQPTDQPVPLDILAWIRTIAPLSILSISLIFSLPLLNPVTRVLKSFFSDLVTLNSVIPPEPSTEKQKQAEQRYQLRAWQQIVMVGAAVVEMGVWMAITGMEAKRAVGHEIPVINALLTAGMVVVWLYLLILPVLRPPSTPPAASVMAYILLWLVSIITLGSAWYVRISIGSLPPWASTIRLLAEGGNVLLITCLLAVISGLHLAAPETLARLPVVAPDDVVTLFSWLSFSWVTPMIRLGNAQELQPEDLPPLSMTLQAGPIFQRFRDTAARSLLFKILWANKFDLGFDASFTYLSVIFNYAGPFFLKRILDGLADPTPETIARAYVYAGLAFLASISKSFSDVLHLWHGRRASMRCKAELTAAIYDKALRRRDVSGVIAEKEGEGDDKDKSKNAKVEKKAANADTGKVVNLMSGDTNRISNTIAAAYYLYSAPFEIVVASIFLYKILGWSAFAGVVVLFVAVPLNAFVSKRSIRITRELMKARDKRVTVMSELISAIQFIKFFAWTQQWTARAADARSLELKQLVRSVINGFWFSMLWNLAPIGVTLISFFCYIVIEGRQLTVSVAFTAISLFTMLQLPLNVIPTFVVMILNAKVSVQRIDDFLQEDEVPDWVSTMKVTPHGNSSEPTRVGFENATFRWNSGKQIEEKAAGSPSPPSPTDSVGSTTTAVEPIVFSLSNLSVDFPIGKLSVVTGPTGSGKTAVLTALLGEMDLVEGQSWLPKNITQLHPTTGLRNSVAYASQTPWLQQKSIKDNILFGEQFEEERYEATLEACALIPDLDILEDGDMTEIGAKGVSLSGGQKARVALARAVYSFTQHLLLDDPLAAVDSHTAKHLTEKCLGGPMLKGRTVILVSHHVELLLPSADYLVRILDGRIDSKGTPDELRASGDLDGLIAVEGTEIASEEPVTADEAVDEEVKVADGGGAVEKKARKQTAGKKLVQDEERAVGKVKWETYKLYIDAATYITWILSFIVLVLIQFVDVGERYWLKLWGEAYNTRFQSLFALSRISRWSSGALYHQAAVHQHILQHTSPLNATTTMLPAILPKLPSAVSHPAFYLSGYAGLLLLSAFLSTLSSMAGAWGQYRAAVNIHDRLLYRVTRGTVRFFNVTPLGRIINRFTRDVEVIDTSLNSSLQTVVHYAASLFGAIAVVAVIVPWFLLPAALISWAYYQYSILYLRAGRSVRRLEATAKSPIFSGFAELLDGVISVRAFAVESRFFKTLCEQVDKSHQAHYSYWMMNRWLLLRFDILGGFSVFLTTLLALSGAVPAGSAGMAILSAQSFVSACYWVSRFWGELEMNFNAVERVQEYLELPQEPPATIESNRPPAYWPSSDSGPNFLSVRELEIKYAPDLPTVFKGSFDIKAGEKIGLIGRTGSGKSTLAMAMLRFNEPASGSIWLDGLDITSVGVDDLRSRITYIPQDAVLFSGTVRDNLDPFKEHTDEELLDALSRVNLGPQDSPLPSRSASRIQSSNRLTAIAAEESQRPASSASSHGPGRAIITLTSDVSAGGSNFSQGQRQLVAMARALLRRSNLIIMDEATASVDFATDEAIQAAIRTEFKSSTLLTIAHRLSSVIDYDRLLVLSDGQVAEFDTPINLLKKDGSLFKSLCENTGKFRELYKAAEKKNREGS